MQSPAQIIKLDKIAKAKAAKAEKARKAREAAAAASSSSGTGNTGATGATGAGATGTGATGGTTPPPTPPPTRPDKNNPLTNRFKTPNELRKQAAALAALSVASEQSIRDQSAARQTGLAGLTTSLTNTLTGLGDRTRTGLAGIGGMYSGLMAGANQAGSTQVAAAGGDPTLASSQTGDPSITSQLLNLTAPTLGYAAAATSTGAQLQAGALQDLSKSLAARSSAISKGTADYLRQLQGEEYQKATGQIAIEQNAERLQLASGNAAWGQQMDLARLDQGQQGLNLRTRGLEAKIAADAAKYGKASGKSKIAAQNRILGIDWAAPIKSTTGQRTYDIYYNTTDDRYGTTNTQKISVQATDSNEAMATAQPLLGGGVINGAPTDMGVYYSETPPSRSAAVARITSLLKNSGMSPNGIKAWISANQEALGLTRLTT